MHVKPKSPRRRPPPPPPPLAPRPRSHFSTSMFDLNSDDSGESEPDLEPLVVQPLLNPAAEDEAAAETTGAGGAAGAVVSAAPSTYTFGGVEHEQQLHDAIVAAGELAANAEEDAAGISLIRSSKASSGFKGVHAKKGKFRAIFEQWSANKRVSKVSLGYYPTARKAASAYALFANSQAVSALALPAATLAATATEAMDVEPNSGGPSSSAAHSEEVALRRSSRKGKQPLDPAIGKRVWSWRQDLQRTMAGEIMDFHVWQDRVREHFVRYEDGVSQWRTEAEWWEDENGPTLPSPQ